MDDIYFAVAKNGNKSDA